MKRASVPFSGIALAVILGGVQSCGATSDCSKRRDCPSDFASRSGAGAGGSAGEGASGLSDDGESSDASGGAGGGDAAGAGGVSETACDPSLTPDADGCVIADEYGLFVAPTGDDATA